MNTLVDLLDAAAEAHRNTAALSIHAGLRDRTWSYRRLRRAAVAVAQYLSADLGLRPGTPLVVWGPNSPQLVATYFGAMMARLPLVPIDPFSTQDFLERIVEETGSPAVIAGFPIDSPILSTRTIPLTALPFDIEAPGFDEGPVEADIAEIVFTSGTTGNPKGVVLTHRNIVANVESARMLVPQRGHRVLSILPLSHMFEQTVGLYVPLLLGSTVHYAASREPPVLLKAMQRYGITSLLVVPQVLELMLNGIEREVARLGKTQQWTRAHRLAPHMPFRLRRRLFASVHRRLGGHLEFVICGGARLPIELEAAWERMGIRVIQGYGTTECSPIVAGNTYWSRQPGSVGAPVPRVRVRISEEDEVLVAGPNVTQGYWNDPETTAAAFDAGGWYHTGDLGRQDTAGRLYLSGRLKDLIVLPSGLNVHPEDVERELRAEPEVDDCVVLSFPDRSGNASVHAAAIPANTDESEETQRELLATAIRNAGARLAPHQRVTGLTVWTEGDFPRTNLLKVKRHEVLAMLSAETAPHVEESPQPQPESDSFDLLRRLLAEVTGVDRARITATTDLGLDLGLDSLGRVELAVLLEDELGTSLEDGDLATVEKVAELSVLLERRPAVPQVPTFPTWSLRPTARAARNLLQRLAVFPLLDLVTKPFSVEGVQNLEQATPPLLFIANHSSHLDTPTILRALPPNLRNKTAVAAAADYFYAGRPAAFAVTLGMNAFPFSREGAVRSSLEYCGDLMDRGWSILIYPEGTRSTSGTMGPFRSGIGLLAAELEAPVLPIGVAGTYEALPKGTYRPLRKPITVRFGPALSNTQSADSAETVDRLETAVRALCGRPGA
jgi:long-chain acyl-CoA synthetase